MSEVFAFEVSVIGTDFKRIINSHTRGKAKGEYFASLRDCLPDIPFTSLRASKLGRPESSGEFISNAAYRGMPDVRCGDRVMVGEASGVIAGHNSSANFDVLFDRDSPKYPGLKLNVHPSSVTRLTT